MFGGCLPVDHRTTDSPSLNHEGNLVDKGNGNAEQKKENRKRRAANKRSAFACLLYRRNILCAELLVISAIKMRKKSY